jgi:hypothetical protein
MHIKVQKCFKNVEHTRIQQTQKIIILLIRTFLLYAEFFTIYVTNRSAKLDIFKQEGTCGEQQFIKFSNNFKLHFAD